MCNCNGAQVQAPLQELFEVRLPDGSIKVVNGEHAARVEVTMAGGGTYSRK